MVLMPARTEAISIPASVSSMLPKSSSGVSPRKSGLPDRLAEILEHRTFPLSDRRNEPFWGDSCPVKSCCEGKGLEHCGKCSDFPCELLSQFAYDKEQGDDTGAKYAFLNPLGMG